MTVPSLVPALGLLAVLASFAGAGALHAVAFAGDPSEVDRMAQEHRHDSPVASPAAMAEPAQPVAGEDAIYGTLAEHSLHGYLAAPKAAAAAARPALIVIHEWWGLNDNIRAMTRRLAGEGYTALAVDLYGGKAATDPDGAKELMGAVLQHTDTALANLKQAYEFLRQRGATRIGVIGWCFGGAWSLQTALAIPDGINAAVVYYGRPETDKEALSRLKAPLLGLYGAADQSIPAASVRAFEALAKELGKSVEIHLYEGAGHAFANPSGTNYRPEAAADAWTRTVAFLKKNL
jgi:carboxymethylenebutenolidase